MFRRSTQCLTAIACSESAQCFARDSGWKGLRPATETLQSVMGWRLKPKYACQSSNNFAPTACEFAGLGLTQGEFMLRQDFASPRISIVLLVRLQGNSYLQASFPKLTYIRTARCLDWCLTQRAGGAPSPIITSHSCMFLVSPEATSERPFCLEFGSDCSQVFGEAACVLHSLSGTSPGSEAWLIFTSSSKYLD